jgi:prepilin-type N-terminal cleavage/methylation domain-containing protein
MSTMTTTGIRRREGQAERGFTLIELLVAMAITTVILGATMVAMNDAVMATDSAKQVTDLNAGLRTATDLVVRDLLQVGQGLPTGRVVGLPNGTGTSAMMLPGPIGSEYPYEGPSFCPPDPNDASPDTFCEQISAVVPGPGRGPEIGSGVFSDMITIVAADSAFERVRLTNFATNGRTVTVNPAVNITNGGPDDVEPGDLLMLSKGLNSLLVQVTAVSGQVLSFAAGDSLNLNQSSTTYGLQWLRAQAPADTNPVAPATFVATEATRIRLISYYLDVVTDPTRPRLIRRMNNGHPTEFDNSRGTVVAFDVENFQITYDLADVMIPGAAPVPITNVRMDDADLGGTGACAPRACSPNQIRKVNLTLSGRSRRPLRRTGDFLHNALVTQVSLRSLAFVDEYR